jgi:predicted transposase/invertase (TIGR01784 family)
MDYNILPPTDDWVFKMLFGDERNKSFLINLLKSLVGLPDEEYELTFLDTHLKQEAEEDKLGILDVKVRTKTGKVINIEIQVNPLKHIGERISFYKSKLIVEQIGKGGRYDVIQRVICICITDFIIFDKENDYLNDFYFMNPKNGLCFKGIPEEIYTLELPKVPAVSDGSSGWDWMQFLRAKRKEEFEMVAAQNTEIRKAVNMLFELSADDKVRAEYEMRLKARLDRNSFLHEAREEGMEKGLEKGMKKGREEGRQKEKEEIARNLKALGIPIEKIAQGTGLTEQQIKEL